MTTDIKELVRRLRDAETRERILGFGGSETLLLFSKEAADALETLAGEVAFVKAQLAGTNKNIAGWLQARDDATMRAAVAELDRDRLAGEVARLTEERDRFLTGGLEADNRTLRATRRAEAAEAERDRLAGEVKRLKVMVETNKAAAERVMTERDRLKAALDWALGEGDEWPERKPGEGAFYWRAELRRRALGDAS